MPLHSSVTRCWRRGAGICVTLFAALVLAVTFVRSDEVIEQRAPCDGKQQEDQYSQNGTEWP